MLKLNKDTYLKIFIALISVLAVFEIVAIVADFGSDIQGLAFGIVVVSAGYGFAATQIASHQFKAHLVQSISLIVLGFSLLISAARLFGITGNLNDSWRYRSSYSVQYFMATPESYGLVILIALFTALTIVVLNAVYKVRVKNSLADSFRTATLFSAVVTYVLIILDAAFSFSFPDLVNRLILAAFVVTATTLMITFISNTLAAQEKYVPAPIVISKVDFIAGLLQAHSRAGGAAPQFDETYASNLLKFFPFFFAAAGRAGVQVAFGLPATAAELLNDADFKSGFADNALALSASNTATAQLFDVLAKSVGAPAVA